jgi:hypothetical protein
LYFCRRSLNPFDRYLPAIPPARQGVDISRLVGRITQGNPKSFDGSVDAIFELNHRVIGPESLLNLLPSNYFAPALEQHGKNLERLLGQPDPHSVLAQFS